MKRCHALSNRQAMIFSSALLIICPRNVDCHFYIETGSPVYINIALSETFHLTYLITVYFFFVKFFTYWKTKKKNLMSKQTDIMKQEAMNLITGTINHKIKGESHPSM